MGTSSTDEPQGYQTRKQSILIVILLMSILLVIASAYECDKFVTGCTNYLNYGIAAASISIIVSIASIVAYGLMIWWGIGAILLTFIDPFTVTSTANFAAWAVFGFSYYYVYFISPNLLDKINSSVSTEDKHKK